MSNLYDYFCLMQAVYNGDSAELPPGWLLQKGEFHKTEKNGFGAACYVNSTRQEMAVVFRGTDNIQNLKDDLRLALGKMPSAFREACELDRKVRTEYGMPGQRIIYLGHSLAAVFAELLACIHHTTAISVESPGIGPLLDYHPRIREGASHADTNIISFLAAPNVINTLHQHVGKLYRVYIGHSDGSISSSHVMKCLLGSLKRGAFLGSAAATMGGSVAAKITVEQALSMAGASAVGQTALQILPLVTYANWLIRQHTLSSFTAEFSPIDRMLVKLAAVREWPALTTLLPHVLGVGDWAQYLKEMVPFHPDVEGLHNLGNENELLENRLRMSMPNYQADILEGDVALQWQKEQFPENLSCSETGSLPHPGADVFNFSEDELIARLIVAYSRNVESRLTAALQPAQSESSSGDMVAMQPPGSFESTALVQLDLESVSPQEAKQLVSPAAVDYRQWPVVFYSGPPDAGDEEGNKNTLQP